MRLATRFATCPAVLPTLATALAAACASGPSASRDVLSNPSAGSVVTTRVDGGANSGVVEIRTASSATPAADARLPGSAEQGYAALAGAYERIGLPVNVALSDTRTYGARNVRAPRRLDKQPLSRFIECGVDAGGVAHADAWAVTLTVLSQVTPAGADASTVSTQVAATARPVTTSGGPINCASNGSLERTVNGAVLLSFAR